MNGAYHGLWTIWTIVDYCALLWHSVDYHELSWILRKCTTMESHGLEDMRLRPLTTPKRYGAGMAHTVVSIGFIDYCRLSCTAWRITVDYWCWWTSMDCHGLWPFMGYYGLLWILDHGSIVDSGLSWYMMDCRGLWTIMHYLELPYPGLLWVI